MGEVGGKGKDDGLRLLCTKGKVGHRDKSEGKGEGSREVLANNVPRMQPGPEMQPGPPT